MLEHWLWLAHRPGINDHLKLLLLQQFDTPEAVYSAPPEEFETYRELTGPGREALEDKSLTLYEEALAQCSRENIQIITFDDPAYPRRLKHIYDPPLLLYCKGKMPQFDGVPVIGIVGTRKPSAYGMNVAQRLGNEISRCGGLVVSGMALGVDGASMSGALAAGCPTVGVLGCGVDIVYPRSNRSLFAAVERTGCILSEFLPGTEPLKWNFPRRNRLISGLSCGVVVVEAPEKSGSLITARYALDQGRDVFTVPGNIDLPSFAGSNRLLREGAAPISCGWDVMSEYQTVYPDKIRKAEPEASSAPPIPEQRKVAQQPKIPREKTPPKQAVPKKDIDNGAPAPYIDIQNTLRGLSANEQAIVSCVQNGERLVDDVIAETGLPSGSVLGILTMLELKRIIVRRPGKRISLLTK